MSYQQGCPGCEFLSIADPLERAHKLLDMYVESGGYDHYGPLQDAMREAVTLRTMKGDSNAD